MKKNSIKQTFNFAAIGLIAAMIGIFSFMMPGSTKLSISKGSRIMLIGNNLGSRMIEFDHFEGLQVD